MWEAGVRFAYSAWFWRRITEQAIDGNFALMPNGLHASREVYLYDADSAEVRAIYVHWGVAIPDAGDIGSRE